MLLRLLILIIAGVVIYRAIKRIGASNAARRDPFSNNTPMDVDDVMIKDPVCGSYFPKGQAVTIESEGRKVHFCSVECRDKYLKKG